MRDAVLVQRDEFAVDDGIAFDAFERFCDLDIVVANDLAVAAVEDNLPPSIFATMRKPSYLSSNIHPVSSNGASVRVASIGCRRFSNVEVRASYGALPSMTFRNVTE